MSTIFGQRLRRTAAVLVAAGALLTGGMATAAQAIEPPPTPDTATETTIEAPSAEAPAPQTDDPDGGVEPKIIGGGAASEPYPFMATLAFVDKNGVDTGHQCGATKVFGQWVLTAAHCVDDPPTGLTATQQHELSARIGMDLYDHVPSEGSFYVRLGSHDRTTGGVTANVTKIVVHEEFRWWENSPPDKANDIAMLKLDRYVQTQHIQIAGKAAEPGTAIRLLGWGITEPDTTGPDPIILQELDTTVAHDAECRFDEQGDLTDGEICTANPNGTDGPCFGDSGGPAIADEDQDGDWDLVGTTSRGGRWCGTTTAIYSSPPDFRTWIYNTARGNPGTGEAVPAKATPAKAVPVRNPVRGPVGHTGSFPKALSEYLICCR